jgi:predicted transcriptional regulator of viral defense system
MHYRKTQDILDELAGHNKRVFAVGDVAKITGKPTGYISKLLSNNKKVKRILKGRYYIAGLNGADIYEIASNIIFPSYISMFAAFQFYSITEQSVIKYSVVAMKRHKSLVVEGNEIEFVAIGRKRFFGYSKVNNSYIATVEKAIVDALYLGAPSNGYMEEVFSKAMQRKVISIDRLVDFTIKMGSKALAKRVAWLLKNEKIKSDRLERWLKA